MGKISPVSAKYIVHANIQIEGTVDRPDVIGAIFGQTEGLLGADLELRELQRSGRIGRIEVNTETKLGKTNGAIIIPTSLDKVETAIIGASLETIQRIGPCNARVRVEKLEDVRVSKRVYVLDRAKELLKELTEKVLPDSTEMAEEVAQSVRMMGITEYGRERLPAGPAIDESEEIIVVEGRADVLNLLKQGFNNVIAVNGTSITETIVELGNQKVLTVFLDGDRGGDLILRELAQRTEIDFVARAPDGKEVEEITKKEIHKALRSKVAFEQIKLEISDKLKEEVRQPHFERPQERFTERPQQRRLMPQKVELPKVKKDNFKKMLDDLIGTRGAYLLDENSNILGKVPTSELTTTIQNLDSVYAVVFDGNVNKDLLRVVESANVKFLVGMNSLVENPGSARTNVLTRSEL